VYALLPLSVSVPAPNFVTPPVFPALIFADSSELAPFVSTRIDAPETVVIWLASVSALTNCKVPPANSRLPLPNALEEVFTANTPARMDVPPVYEFAPLKVTVPAPFFTKAPVLVESMTPLKVAEYVPLSNPITDVSLPVILFE
jgi:hypothetical protein